MGVLIVHLYSQLCCTWLFTGARPRFWAFGVTKRHETVFEFDTAREVFKTPNREDTLMREDRARRVRSLPIVGST